MRAVRVFLVSVACVLAAAPAATAQTSAVDVTVNRSEVAIGLGDGFSFSTEVKNASNSSLSGLVAHLNVVGLSSGIYVDPEDWSDERTKNVPDLGPGESTSISWSVTAVTGGRAAVYVVVLPEDPARGGLAASPAIDVRIAEEKNLNSGGVLPLALGVPALLGLATIAVRRRRGR